jgi:hypothetical protein
MRPGSVDYFVFHAQRLELASIDFPDLGDCAIQQEHRPAAERCRRVNLSVLDQLDHLDTDFMVRSAGRKARTPANASP